MKHTPTPWKLTKGDRAFAFNIIHDSQNGGTAVVRDVLKEENAAFIVRAVNAHEELLEAAKNALNVLAGVAQGDLKTIKRDSPALRMLRNAIAKAEGK